jgi:drug/metabolite transporter (DMT)-like permease
VSQRSELNGYLLTAAAPIAVGTGVVATSFLGGYPVFTGQGLRYLIGAIILLFVAKNSLQRFRTLRPSDVLLLLALSLFGLVIFSVAVVEGVRSSSPALVGDVIGCAPLLIELVGAAISQRPPSKWISIGALTVAIGTALVSGSGHGGLVGLGWAGLALVGDATFTLVSAHLLPKLGAANLAFSTTGIAALLLLAIGLFRNHTLLTVPSAQASLSIAYLGLVVSVGAFLAWFGGLERVPVGNASLFLGLTPLASLMGQALLLNYRVSHLALFGTLLVAVGITSGIAQQSQLLRRSRKQTSPRRLKL